MPKNFDATRRPVAVDDERTFIIQGNQFMIRERAKPELLAVLEEISTDKKAVENISTIDYVIEQALVESDIPRWRDARANEAGDVLELSDLQEIVNWAMEILTQRPLDNAPSSGGTSETTVPTSPAPAFLQVAVPSPSSMPAAS